MWTIRLPDDVVSVDATGRVVTVDVTNAAVVDERIGGGRFPAVASFHLQWKGRGGQRPLTTSTPPFTGTFFKSATARGTFAASEDGFAFTGRKRAKSTFALVGMEQNGLFAAARCPSCALPARDDPTRRP